MKRYLALSLLAACATAAAEEASRSTRRGDMGARYWLSTGETNRAHNAQGVVPSAGNPTSVLLYENLDANVFELFARQSTPRDDAFLKGTVGIGRINRGSFDDEDFSAGQVKFSDTTSSVTQGRIGYVTLDVGRQWVRREGAVRLGLFGGFTQWTEDMDAYELCSILRADPATRLALDLAFSPYAKVRNEDSHYQRADLGPVPNIILEGEGWGVQWDAELRHEIRRRTELGVGVRYWHMETTKGTRQLPNVPSFPETPLTELYSTRFGVTLSLRRTW